MYPQQCVLICQGLKTLFSNARAVLEERVLSGTDMIELGEVHTRKTGLERISWSPLTYVSSSQKISSLTWYVTLILRPVTLA